MDNNYILKKIEKMLETMNYKDSQITKYEPSDSQSLSVKYESQNLIDLFQNFRELNSIKSKWIIK